VENGYSEKHLTEHRLKLNIQEKVKNYFLC